VKFVDLGDLILNTDEIKYCRKTSSAKERPCVSIFLKDGGFEVVNIDYWETLKELTVNSDDDG
jgi:hypothetical protein